MVRSVMMLAAILAALMLQGCYEWNAARTQLEVQTANCTAKYSSNKEQVGLAAKVCGGEVSVDKSGSSEAVLATLLQVQLKMLELIQQIQARQK